MNAVVPITNFSYNNSEYRLYKHFLAIIYGIMNCVSDSICQKKTPSIYKASNLYIKNTKSEFVYT